MNSRKYKSNFFDKTLNTDDNFKKENKKFATKILTGRESTVVASPTDGEDLFDVQPWRINLHIEESEVDIIFEIKNTITIGRLSNQDHLPNKVDLSFFNAHELGVSRIHAEFRQKNKQIVLIDKGSSNGTFLNTKRLVSDTEYIVRHGDKIGLGNLNLSVYFLTAMFSLTKT